jgi:hypothetical protein
MRKKNLILQEPIIILFFLDKAKKEENLYLTAR